MNTLERIDHPNDRCILFMLEYYESKTKKDERRLKKLKSVYTTNYLFEGEIKRYLYSMEFLKSEGEFYQDEFGQDIYIDGDPKISLTREGIIAYQNGFFKSEIEENRREYFKIKLSNFSIAIAIVGGIAGVITSLITIYTHFCK